VGTTADLARLVARYRVEVIVVAIPSATGEQMRRLTERCSGLGVEFKIVPPLGELLDGRARLSQLRAVKIEDLLGREPIRLDMHPIHADLRGKTVLITGGAGSIGSELARQIASYEPSRLILMEQAESALYFINHELLRSYPDTAIVPVIADVANSERIDRIFAEYRPDYVLHAAAYKHVPMMESNVPEAVRNNIFGTLSVAQAAARHGVKKFVLISTDKAVNPSSVMGATKRVAERLILGLPELRDSRTDFRAVRFGNVLGSDGSVIPLFKRQIEAGGPVTVTHRDVTRFFMTIPEAVQLVLQAAALPEATRRIAMLEMGEPIKIVTLAENLIRLSGLEPYTEMPIVFSGLRPGEKLYEELMTEAEETVPTAVEKIRIVRTDEGGAHEIEVVLRALVAGLLDDDVDAILAAIQELVPESVSPLRERCGHAREHALAEVALVG
jgi:FlaA1/EpsC-like NDP-sugar epimerase